MAPRINTTRGHLPTDRVHAANSGAKSPSLVGTSPRNGGNNRRREGSASDAEAAGSEFDPGHEGERCTSPLPVVGPRGCHRRGRAGPRRAGRRGRRRRRRSRRGFARAAGEPDGQHRNGVAARRGQPRRAELPPLHRHRRHRHRPERQAATVRPQQLSQRPLPLLHRQHLDRDRHHLEQQARGHRPRHRRRHHRHQRHLVRVRPHRRHHRQRHLQLRPAPRRQRRHPIRLTRRHHTTTTRRDQRGGPTNAPPVAGDDTATTPAATPVTINVAANDTDPNGNLNPASATTTCTGCATPTNGTLTNNTNGTFTYTPTTGFTGTDNFTYQICDTLNACDTATVTINVTPVATNAPPVAGDDTATTPAATPVTINVAANDTDPNGNLNPASATTTCTGCATPTNGTLTNNANGTFTYTPTTGFTGTDNFTYQICDTDNACDTATVTINVTPVATNAPPVAGDDTATTPAATPVTINVAANDTDPNGNLNPASATTTCTGCTTPTNGTLTNNANGTFTYTPTTGFTGTDNFTYQICDTDNACDTATVTINVNTVSAPQTLAAAADSRVLQASPTVNSGTVNRLDVDSPGEQSYLRFNVTGVTGTVQSATLRLFVRNSSANAPSLYFTANTWTETGITWNNKPAATGPAIADVTTATNGTWSEYDLTGDITGNGTYNFVLLPDGTDGIQYDSREGTSPPQLVLNGGGGGPTNAPPVAGDDTATTTAGTPVTINVAANDQDPNGNLSPASATTTCTGCANPGHGTLTNNANGTFTYTPTTGFTGTDSFTYQICDTLNACDTAAVTINVYAVGTGSEVFVGAGDIADCARTTDDATANLLDNIPGTVFTIGDNAYPATTAGLNNCYAPTWGRQKARTHPTAGDNDYDQTNAAPYYSYFGAAAGDPTKGYYSYNLGAWHIIHLNSNCSNVGGCRASSPQGQWLQADLAANPRACILALHHEPLFSSKGGDSDMRDFWTPLYAAGADVVLSGHRHNYERFAPQTPAGVADPARGIRQFVVGTGGSSLSSASSTIAANSQVRNSSTHGVIRFTLHPTSYDWQFVPIAGQTFTDSGSTSCVAS